jgi:hypothetical protein
MTLERIFKFTSNHVPAVEVCDGKDDGTLRSSF